MADAYLDVSLMQEGDVLDLIREVAECWVVMLARSESECDMFMAMLGMDEATLLEVRPVLAHGFSDRGLAARRHKRKPMTL